MMKELREILQKWGLEHFSVYYSVYPGIVFDNKDPKVAGRIRIEVPGIYHQSPNIWALPRGQYVGKNRGFYAVPAVGDPVWITFRNGNVKYPLWEYGWYGDNDGPTGRKETKQIFQNATDSRLEFDEETGEILITNKQGFTIKLDSEGISIGKGDTNLFKLLDETLEGLANAKTATLIGPQPLINAPLFVALRVKLAQFLKA